MTLLRSPALPRILPFAAYILLLAVEQIPGVQFGSQAANWMYAARAGAAGLLLLWCWRSYSELRGTWPASTQWLLAVAVGVAVFVIWIALDQPWARLGGGEGGFDPYNAAGHLDWVWITVRWCGAALVVPVMEELFWRSYLLRWVDAKDFLAIRPQTVSLRAVLITSALFALEHHLVVAGFVAGLVYSWLYVRTGRLWVPIAAHAVTNGVLGVWVIQTGAWGLW
jgi:hypothetical protein